MADLRSLLRSGRSLRAVGFDDAPFTRAETHVGLCGVVTRGTRFEGMLWSQVTRDGDDATAVIGSTLVHSKFASQVHVLLTDGLTTGGLNVLDLAALHERVEVPCIAVMRRMPDVERFNRTLVLAGHPERQAIVLRAGPIHQDAGFVFQCAGCEPEVAGSVLEHLTDQGKVPEPLRLAHLIGSAVITGQSGRRA